MLTTTLKLWRTAGAAAALVGLAGCYPHGHGGYAKGAIMASAASKRNAARAADNRRLDSCE